MRFLVGSSMKTVDFTIFAVSHVRKTQKIVKHRQCQRNKFSHSFQRRFYSRTAFLAWHTIVHFTPVQANRVLFGPTFTSEARAWAEGADSHSKGAHLAPNLPFVASGEYVVAQHNASIDNHCANVTGFHSIP